MSTLVYFVKLSDVARLQQTCLYFDVSVAPPGSEPLLWDRSDRQGMPIVEEQKSARTGL
jgi:hypothetical protein